MSEHNVILVDGTKLCQFDEGWISGAIYFSSDMYDLSGSELNNHGNLPLGPLQTIYDVQIKAGTRLESDNDFHPHKNVDIFSYVVCGCLYDAVGDADLLKGLGYVNGLIGKSEAVSEPGDSQFIHSGMGIHHSVYCRTDEPLRFIQLFLSPTQKDDSPRYSTHTALSSEKNQWVPLAAWQGGGVTAPLLLEQDVNISVAVLEPLKAVEIVQDASRQACVLVIDGEADLGGISLRAKDAAIIKGDYRDMMKANSRAHVMLIDMAMS